MTSKQRAYLRSLANTMEPIIHVGKDGVNENMIKQASDALEARELIKGTVLQNSPMSARDAIAALCPLGAQHGAQVVQPLAKLAPGGRKVFPHGAQKARRKAAQCAHHQQHAIKHPQHGALAGARKAQQRIFCFKADIIQNFAHTVPKGKGRKNCLSEPGRLFPLWRRRLRPPFYPALCGADAGMA